MLSAASATPIPTLLPLQVLNLYGNEEKFHLCHFSQCKIKHLTPDSRRQKSEKKTGSKCAWLLCWMIKVNVCFLLLLVIGAFKTKTLCEFVCERERGKEGRGRRQERKVKKGERHQSAALSCSCQASLSPVSSHPAVRLCKEEERGEISHQPYGLQFCQRHSALCGQMANSYI